MNTSFSNSSIHNENQKSIIVDNKDVIHAENSVSRSNSKSKSEVSIHEEFHNSVILNQNETSIQFSHQNADEYICHEELPTFNRKCEQFPNTGENNEIPETNNKMNEIGNDSIFHSEKSKKLSLSRSNSSNSNRSQHIVTKAQCHSSESNEEEDQKANQKHELSNISIEIPEINDDYNPDDDSDSQLSDSRIHESQEENRSIRSNQSNSSPIKITQANDVDEEIVNENSKGNIDKSEFIQPEQIQEQEIMEIEENQEFQEIPEIHLNEPNSKLENTISINQTITNEIAITLPNIPFEDLPILETNNKKETVMNNDDELEIDKSILSDLEKNPPIKMRFPLLEQRPITIVPKLPSIRREFPFLDLTELLRSKDHKDFRDPTSEV